MKNLTQEPVKLYHSPSCGFQHLPAAEHGPYCLHHVGRGLTGYTPGEAEVELSVAVASRVHRDGEDHDTTMRHLNVVQLSGWVGDRQVTIDYKPGEVRSFLAILTSAADIADGVTR